MVAAKMDGKNCLEPSDWDFISDNGSIAGEGNSCAMYVNGKLVEFSWESKSNMVVLSSDAKMVAEKFNKECAGGEVVARAISDKAIELLQDYKGERLKELKTLVERYGDDWCYNHQYDLGIESAEKVLDIFNNGGLDYYDEKSDQSVAIWGIYIASDGKLAVSFIWNRGKDLSWAEDAEFNIDDFGAFSDWEIDLIIKKVKEIWHE